MAAIIREGPDPLALGAPDRARFWRVPQFGRLECLAARFETYCFAPHTHDTYGVAVFVDGAQRMRWRGQSHLVPAGSVLAMSPGEAHDGVPFDTSYTYRTIFPEARQIRRLTAEIYDGEGFEPLFAETVIHDAELARRVAAMHRTLEAPTPVLERQAAVIDALGLLLRRYARRPARLPAAGPDRRLVARLCDYIEGHLARDVSLDELADEAGLSRYHLLRVFRRTTGLTPHAYLLNRRVARARRLLAAGATIADTALDCGFFDQSHLTRVFKRHVGVTPGQYRQNSNPVQDVAA